MMVDQPSDYFFVYSQVLFESRRLARVRRGFAGLPGTLYVFPNKTG